MVGMSYPTRYYYSMQFAQLEKCKGKLKALVAMNYDPAKGPRDENYNAIKQLVDCIIEELDSEIVADDSGYWLGEWGKCEVDKYIVNEDCGVIFYKQGRPYTVDIFEKYFDYAECGIEEALPDEKALPLMKEKIDTLDWTEAIIVYIDLPEMILREV